MTNDQFLLFPMLSYGYKNTVGAVAHLFFSDPPFAPHATPVAVGLDLQQCTTVHILGLRVLLGDG